MDVDEGGFGVYGEEVVERVGAKDGAAGCSDDRFAGVGGELRGAHVDGAGGGGDRACVVNCIVELGVVLYSLTPGPDRHAVKRQARRNPNPRDDRYTWLLQTSRMSWYLHIGSTL